ncbi:MAG: PAS domain S-box protein, partial [Proteobacteria bacterium]
MESRGYKRWIETLSHGNIISGNVREFPESEQEVLIVQGVQSIASVPIMVNGLWWGSLECDECRREREWDEAELDAMRLCAELIGAAIARQKTDELLRESEREMRAVFSAMRDVIFVLDRNGVYKKIISYDNDLLFLPNDELVSLRIVDVMGEELGRPLLDAIQNVLDTGKLHRLEYELPISGVSKRFLASVSPLTPDQVLWVARDISEVHQTRESLRESEALFRLLAENSSDSISIVRPDGTFTYLSPMTSRLTGFSDEELEKSNIFELIHPEDWDETIGTLSGLFLGTKNIVTDYKLGLERQFLASSEIEDPIERKTFRKNAVLEYNETEFSKNQLLFLFNQMRKERIITSNISNVDIAKAV